MRGCLVHGNEVASVVQLHEREAAVRLEAPNRLAVHDVARVLRGEEASVTGPLERIRPRFAWGWGGKRA